MAIPYSELNESKKKQVASMFDSIAGKYDFLNHFLSVGIDKLWRKKAISILKKYSPETIIDVATGTGDFAIQASKINPLKITGIDISEGMLEVGRKKIKKLNLDTIVTFSIGDSENIHEENNSFDAATCAFGVRNFENLELGISEIYRVLKNKGVCIILEFSKPRAFPIKQIYFFYFSKILPLIGKFFSKDRRAYEYLPESVKEFPSGKEFIEVMKKAGFNHTKLKSLSFGIATIYIGEK